MQEDDKEQFQDQPAEQDAQPAQTQSQPRAGQHLPGQAPIADYPVRIHSRRRAQPEAPVEPAVEPSIEPPTEAPAEDIYAVNHPDIIEQRLPSAPPQRPVEEVFEVQPFQETPEDREQAYIQQQEARLAGLPEATEVEAPVVKPCRHEYVRIFQRKLKDLNRRMVCTKAYLPVGFKMGDFSHLGENSFCFCATCRVRLYPKRSQAEKAEARVQLALGKAMRAELAQSQLSADLLEEVGAKAFKELLMRVENDEDPEQEETDDANVPKVDIHVEELEQEVVGVEDIDVESLKGNQEEDSCEMLDQEEM